MATQRLRPVGGEPLAVLGMEPVAQRMADHFVGHHPGVPCVGLAQQTVGTTRGLVYRPHVPKMARRCAYRRSRHRVPWTPLHELVFGLVSTSSASPWTIHL
jgi:hypothetical protein